MSILGRGGTISERIRNVLTDWIWYYSSVFNWGTPLIYLFYIKGQAIRLAFLCIKLLSKLPCKSFRITS